MNLTDEKIEKIGYAASALMIVISLATGNIISLCGWVTAIVYQYRYWKGK